MNVHMSRFRVKSDRDGVNLAIYEEVPSTQRHVFLVQEENIWKG